MESISHGLPVRVFIGSGEASLLERKTLIYSLRKHTKRPLDIYVFNGTHNSIERNDEDPYPCSMPLKVKYRNVTEFSLYRFLIPEICGHQGKALWIDSDTVCLSDIGLLFDTAMNGKNFLAKKDAYTGEKSQWGLSVMLIDCENTRFDLERDLAEIDDSRYAYGDLTCMTPEYLKVHPFSLGELDPRWNEFDELRPDTKLIHYTNLFTQPWKFPNHPYGELWFKYFNEARAAGFITDWDIEKTIVQAYARKSLLNGNFTPFGRELGIIKSFVRSRGRRLKRLFSWQA